MDDFNLVKPEFIPPLEEAFRPAALANHAFQREVGSGGDWILGGANQVLQSAFPHLASRILLPDERSRHVGQSIAAASLPILNHHAA